MLKNGLIQCWSSLFDPFDDLTLLFVGDGNAIWFVFWPFDFMTLFALGAWN
jgi:hypothetical protein